MKYSSVCSCSIGPCVVLPPEPDASVRVPRWRVGLRFCRLAHGDTDACAGKDTYGFFAQPRLSTRTVRSLSLAGLQVFDHGQIPPWLVAQASRLRCPAAG